MKSSSETCFQINGVDDTVSCDVTSAHSVQAVNDEDVEVMCDLYGTATLPTQMLCNIHNQYMMSESLDTLLENKVRSCCDQDTD